MERFFMERLKYIVEDSTIAELLGVQNFTNKESAILELVKNAYDAQANNVSITFSCEWLHCHRPDRSPARDPARWQPPSLRYLHLR